MSKLILEKLTENQLETLRILLDENRIANDIELLFEIRDDIIDEFANANAEGNDIAVFRYQYNSENRQLILTDRETGNRYYLNKIE